jgi:hypothetical protein
MAGDTGDRREGMTPGGSIERLAHHLYPHDPGDPMAVELTGWLSGSPRFRDYADTYRDKIRKKLRTATDPEALRDVRAELAVARLLLADRRFEVAFEAYGSGKIGPDLTVTFRGRQQFNLEVTRPHRLPDTTGIGAIMLAKLRQLPPSVPNAIVIAIPGSTAAAVDIHAAALALRSRADAKDEAFFADRGFDGSRGFYDRFLRLGAVFSWSETGVGEGRATSWTNRSARIPLPDPASRACLTCLRA